MIKVDHGNIEISGTGPDLTYDLVCIVRGIKKALKNNGFPKELVDTLVADAIRHADMSPEEIAKEAFDSLMQVLRKPFKTPETEN